MTAFVTLARRFFCVLLSCLLLGTQTYYSCAAVATLVPTPMPPADALHSSLAMPAALPAALTALDTQIAAVCIGAQSYTWPAIVITDAQADTLLRNVYTAGCTVKRIYQKSSSDTTRIAYSASYCNSLLAYGRYAYSRAQYRESSQAFLRVLEHINALPVTYCFQFDQNYAALADTGVKNAANAWAVITTGNEPKITTDEPTGTAQNSEQASTATCNGKQTSTAPPPESKAPALGCPIHSVDADTLNVFLTDMPLAYQPVKGPPVELKLVYSATRTTPSCLDRKWHCSLDSWLTIISASGWPRHEWPLSQPLSEKINGQDKLITAVQIVTPSGRLDMYTYNGCEPIGPLESNTFRVYFRSGEDDPRDAHIAHRANTLALDVRATREDYNGYIHWTFEQAVASMPDGYTYTYDWSTPATRTNLVSIADKNGNAIRYERDGSYTPAQNNVNRIIDACGRTSTVAYTYCGLQITDPRNRTASFVYDLGQDFITDAAGYKTVITYNNSRVASYQVYDTREPSRVVHQAWFEYTPNSVGVLTRVVVRDSSGGIGEGTYEIFQWDPGVFYTQNKNMYAHMYRHYANLDADYWAVKTAADGVTLTSSDFHLATQTEKYGGISVRKVYATPEANSPVAATSSTALDDRGNLTQFTDASGRAYGFTYDASNNLICAVAPGNATNAYLYDTRGNLARTIAPDGRWSRAYAYNANGQLTNVLAFVRTERVPMTIGPLEPHIVTNLVYETVTPAAAPAAAEVPMPESVEEVDALIESLITPAAANAFMPAPVSAPLVATGVEITTTTSANPLQWQEDLRHMVDVDVCATLLAIEYAADNSSAVLTYPSGEKVTYSYDEVGQVTQVFSTPKNATTPSLLYALAYDGLGRVTAVTYPDGTTVNSPMNLKGPAAITDRDGKTTTLAYNDSFQTTGVTRPDNQTVNFGYAGWRLRQLTNARSNVSTFDYDGGRLTGLQYPGCNPQRYGYDWPGNLTSVTNEDDQVILYAHDAAGRVTNTSLSSAQSATLPTFHSSYSYNPAGRLRILTDNTGMHTYGYDLRGRLTNDCFVANAANALSYTIAYAYDNLDNRTNMIVAPAGVNGAAIPAHSIAYEYDYATMTLKSITDATMTPGQKTVQYAYDAKGRLQTTTYANSAGQEYAYNSDNRLDHLTTRGAAGYLINDQIYHYTPGGVLNGISAYAGNSSFAYDALNQITNESSYVGVNQSGNNLYVRRAYDYDANGNRTNELRTDVLPNVGATAVSRTYNDANGNQATADDRIVSYNQTSSTPALQYSAGFTYDARGNRLQKNVGAASTPRTFGYDAFSRMTVATNGANSVVYTYDAVGRKVKRLKRDATIYPDSTYYVYDGLDPVCMVEFNPAHTECTTVTWLTRGLGVAPGIGNIVAQQRYTINFNGTASQPVMHYYHPNHRGDTAYLTDASGVKVASYIYDAFGRMLTDSPATLTDYRFSGKEWDPDAQLYYFGFRWYDPDTGTWTTKDPLKFRGGDINIYRFASNDPLNHHDSYGLWTTANMTDGSQFNNDPMLSNTFAEIRQAERDTWNQGLDNYAEGLNTLVEAVDGVSLAIKAGIKWLIGLLKIDPCS